VELPPDIARLLGRLRDGLLARGGLVGIYLYGSLVTGDFSPARSDIDVIVMVEREPDNAAISELRRLHEALAALAGSGSVADRLHCLYVPADSGVLRPVAAARRSAGRHRGCPGRRFPGAAGLLASGRPPLDVLAAGQLG
jgi:predicted nucleotidyltransferase